MKQKKKRKIEEEERGNPTKKRKIQGSSYKQISAKTVYVLSVM